MRPKQFLILLGSTLTVAGPAENNMNPSIRNIETTFAIELTARADALCGEGAHYDSKSKACVCDAAGKIYDSRSKTCSCPAAGTWYDGTKCAPIPNCGPAASWDMMSKCVCNNPVLNFSEEGKTCTCPPPKELDGDLCKLNCGNDAEEKDSICECKISGAIFTSDGKTCSCPSGQTPVNSVCTVDCGKDATLTANTCICKKEGQVFNSVDRTCECGSGQVLINNQCQPKPICGKDAVLNKDNQCECISPRKTWDANTSRCICSPSKPVAQKKK